MPHFYDILLDVLKADERFVAQDGTLLRNAVYESAMQMDAALIHLLLSNTETKQHFFTDVDGTLVFDKVGFGWVVNNRQFLPDSYTRFKNKIGLADAEGQLISASGDVSLVFPYKDCVLEGGQTKEDQNRKEVFFNQMLAPDEVDRLLYPKVLTKTVKFDSNGAAPVTVFNNDNLIIRGNNLLSLYSLLPVFEQRVKCIYIDPPYNTGDDEFNYNDSFNHSTWLVFMKNLSQEDWFPYTDNFGTSEEKAFVAYFKQYVPSLRQKYSKVYLVRNEREFHLYSFDSGERFEPDYVLFLQKPNNEGFEQLQIFIEPKGDHLLENDRWKEDFLLQMREQTIPVKKYVDDNQYRIWGFHFFNQNFRSMPFGEEMASLLE